MRRYLVRGRYRCKVCVCKKRVQLNSTWLLELRGVGPAQCHVSTPPPKRGPQLHSATHGEAAAGEAGGLGEAGQGGGPGLADAVGAEVEAEGRRREGRAAMGGGGGWLWGAGKCGNPPPPNPTQRHRTTC